MQPVQEKLDAQMGRFYPPHGPGAALGIIRDGKPLVFKGYGLADVESELPVTTATNFRMGSVSKQFTAMGVLLLAEQGKMELGDPLRRFLPGLTALDPALSVHQLLVHGAGIGEFEPFISSKRRRQISDQEVLRLLTRRPASFFSPANSFRYSNTGYCLASLIIQQVSGMPFSKFVQESIFMPLGMRHSVVYKKGRRIMNRAYGYHPGETGFMLADQNMTSATQGDGGIYTSLADYFKWLEALDKNILVCPEISAQIFSPHMAVYDGITYGYGWFLGKEKDGTRCWFHSGESTGFHLMVYWNPAHQSGIVLFSNRDDDTLEKAFAAVLELLAEDGGAPGAELGIGPRSLVRWLSDVYGDKGSPSGQFFSS